MRYWFLMRALAVIMEALLDALDEEVVKGFLDKLLDMVEDTVEASENPIDDQVLPLIKHLRSIMDIPDNDDLIGDDE